MSKKTSQSGASLIEVAIVAFFLLVILTALISVVTMSVSRNRQAKERAVATRLAQEAVEWLRFERDRLGFSRVEPMADSTFGIPQCLNELPDPPDSIDTLEDVPPCAVVAEIPGTDFVRQVTLTTILAGDEIGYNVSVTWPKAGGEEDNVTLTGVLNQWQK